MQGRARRTIADGNRCCFGFMVVILLLLSMIPILGVSEEQTEKKPLKPRFERSSQVLKDNKTGLMWSLNADIAGRTFSWDGAQDYIVRLNLDKYAGYRDWRAPSLEELGSLIEHVRAMGFDGSAAERTVATGFRDMGVQNVQSDGYWTSTDNIYYSAEAWYVTMTTGASSLGDKALYFFLWPVRLAK